MKAPEPALHASYYSDDELLSLQQRIAQRADEYVRRQGGYRGNDLEIWLRAEEEVLEEHPVPIS